MGLTDEETFTRWFNPIRRVVVFLLGMAVIIDALWDQSFVVPELIIGMILVGVLPLSDFLPALSKRRAPPGGG